MATINVEAFDTHLHGTKILCQGPFPSDKLPPVLDAVKNIRDPFKKTVLLTKDANYFKRCIPITYDATYQISESADWSLALTYMSHCPKPALIIIDNLHIPDAFWAHVTRRITCIHWMTSPVALKPQTPYDSVFFASIQDIHLPYTEFVFNQIKAVYSSTYSQKEFREILQELRIAGAGLVWTRINEKSAGGSIYWYDVTRTQDTLSKRQISDILQWLSIQIAE